MAYNISKLSFVIPCYRSENTIKGVVDEIVLTIGDKYDYEIILVNDYSPDNTYAVICDICRSNGNVRGISLSKNFGQASAIMAGLKYTKGEVVVCLDDDGQAPIEGLSALLSKINDGYDIAMAEYTEKKESPFRLFGSRINEMMQNSFLNKPKDIVFTSFFACRRNVVDEMLRYEGSFTYLAGLMLRATRSIVNVKLDHREREEGQSGYTLRKLISLWLNGFTSFSIKPLRFATFLGMFFAVAGFFVLIGLVIQKLTNPQVQIGWTSIVSLMIFFNGIILVVLGLIGEYIGRIYLCINSTPQYVIREMTGFDAGDQ